MIGLRKCLEAGDRIDLFGRHADATIDDSEVHQTESGVVVDLNRHEALVRKLDCIASEIEQDLPQLGGVRLDADGQPRVAFYVQSNSLAQCNNRPTSTKLPSRFPTD